MSVLICTLCLSSDRNLIMIDERSFQKIYSWFDVKDAEYLKYLQMEGSLRACWLCEARLNSCARFAASAQLSVRTLRSYLSSAYETPFPLSRCSFGITDMELVDVAPKTNQQYEPQTTSCTSTQLQAPQSSELGAPLATDKLEGDFNSESDFVQVLKDQPAVTALNLDEDLTRGSFVGCSPEPPSEDEAEWKEEVITDVVKADVAGKEATVKKKVNKENVKSAKTVKTAEGQGSEASKARVRRKRVKPTSYQCRKCKESFATFALIREHRLRCKTYKCASCDKTYKTHCGYYAHIQKHDETSKEKLYCDVCKRHFSSAVWFKRHFRTSFKHVSRDDFRHKCPHCSMRFFIPQLLKEHVAAKHLNRGLHACDQCPKTFTVRNSLLKHCARAHNMGSFVCEHCGLAFSVFSSPRKLMNHIAARHESLSVNSFKCACGKRYNTNKALQAHKKRHGGQLPPSRGGAI